MREMERRGKKEGNEGEEREEGNGRGVKRVKWERKDKVGNGERDKN